MALHYGLATAGPHTGRLLYGWAVNTTSPPTGVSITLVRAKRGADGSQRLGLGVMRAILDASATTLATKYDNAVNAINLKLHDQQVRDDVVDQIRDALQQVGEMAVLQNKWDEILRILGEDHPLNPRIHDAHSAIEHLGGMQLHLSSKKRKRAQDAGNDPDDPEAYQRRTVEQTALRRLHSHSDAHYTKMFQGAAYAAAACIAHYNPQRIVYRRGTDMLFQARPEDYGCAGEIPEGGYMLVNPHDGTTYIVDENADPRPTIQQRNARDPAREWDPQRYENLRPACIHESLIQPAMAAAAVQGAIYAQSVRRVADLMQHADGFEQGTCQHPAFMKETQDHAARTAEDEKWQYARLVQDPDQEQDVYDCIIDFDDTQGWSLGFGPSDTTDAVEAVQAYIHAEAPDTV